MNTKVVVNLIILKNMRKLIKTNSHIHKVEENILFYLNILEKHL